MRWLARNWAVLLLSALAVACVAVCVLYGPRDCVREPSGVAWGISPSDGNLVLVVVPGACVDRRIP